MAGGLPSLAEDALAAHLFSVEIDGVQIAKFKEIDGISSEIKVIEIQENTAQGKPFVKKVPGPFNPPTLKLKRGMDMDMSLYKWHQSMRDKGDVPGSRKNGSIVFYSYEGAEVARYNFTNAWISKYNGGGGKAGSTDVLLEDVEIPCETLERIK